MVNTLNLSFVRWGWERGVAAAPLSDSQQTTVSCSLRCGSPLVSCFSVSWSLAALSTTGLLLEPEDLCCGYNLL